ncbi:hypothetical protein AMK68_01860 [candidate division KD3-62 bacterium DG_56]|uniref:Uncharacterized protein n=1 Tax=candidate division KD3-62 bacterium DG_56 TaxID=1704032 RepID=A0A0S7XQ49_9BACT|nr:MAG: hypothetical protein AMK68_01860 [candidate division KD3-62 bacterium DG_56]
MDRVFRAAVLLWVAAAVAGALVGMRAFLGVALGGALAVTMFGIQRRLAYCCLSRAVSGARARALLWLYWCRLPALGAGLFYLLRADAASLPALCFGVGVVPMAVIIAAVRPGDEL